MTIFFRWMDEPGSRARRRSQFRATYSTTIKDLIRELEAVRAKAAIVAAGFLPSQIRNDGLPYSGARPKHPAVAVHFEIKGESIAIPCDTFTTFEENLRAVALSLEALRKVDRYGCTRNNEQYRGWLRIEAPDPARVIKDLGGLSASPEQIRSDPQPYYRSAAKAAHPDAATGSHEKMVALQAAYEALRKGAS